MTSNYHFLKIYFPFIFHKERDSENAMQLHSCIFLYFDNCIVGFYNSKC